MTQYANYFSVAVINATTQGNLQNEKVTWAMVPEGESITMGEAQCRGQEQEAGRSSSTANMIQRV